MIPERLKHKSIIPLCFSLNPVIVWLLLAKTSQANWLSLSYPENAKIQTPADLFVIILSSDAWCISPAEDRLSTTGAVGKTSPTSSSVWWRDLTCRLQQNVVVCSSLSGRVILRLLPLRLLITDPVWLQFPPGEHLHPVIFLLNVLPFIVILKDNRVGHTMKPDRSSCVKKEKKRELEREVQTPPILTPDRGSDTSALFCCALRPLAWIRFTPPRLLNQFPSSFENQALD